MADSTSGTGKGLLESLTLLAATLVAIMHTRLHLLSADLEEEREHLVLLLVLALTALFCVGVGVVLSTILLVVLYWDTHRLLVLGLCAGFFLISGAAAWAFAVHKAKTKPRLFAATLAELFKDRQQLMPRS